MRWYIAAGAIAFATMAGSASAKPPIDCHRGAWIDDRGVAFAITQRDETSIRLRSDSGVVLAPKALGGGFTDRWTIAPAPCDASVLTYSDDGGVRRSARRVSLTIEDFTVPAADGTTLAARMILPVGGTPKAMVVMVHGSERFSGIERYSEPWLLAARGIGALVYDKRGTGKSGGGFTQDFGLLAQDAAAILAAARHRAAATAPRIGFWGNSQGARIATRAASLVKPDFIVAGYGTAGSPIDEDREEVAYRLAERGYGPDVLAKAAEVTAATAMLRRSGFKSGFDQLAEAKRKWGKEPWWRDLDGEYTGEIAKRPAWQIKMFAAAMDRGRSVPWDEDSRPFIQGYDGPQLWILARDDDEAPSASTQAFLAERADAGQPIRVVSFPGTTHGIRTFTGGKTTPRVLGDHPAGYLPLAMTWIATRELPPVTPGADIVR